MLLLPTQQVGEGGYGIVFEGNVSKGYIFATPRPAPNDHIIDERICSDTLTALPSAFRLVITFGGSEPSPTQTLRITSVDTWNMSTPKSSINIPGDLTAYRELRFTATGAVKALWLERPRSGASRSVLMFGSDWTGETELWITLRTDLDTPAKRQDAAETFLEGQPATVACDMAAWTYV
jgi:hypothetical protein